MRIDLGVHNGLPGEVQPQVTPFQSSLPAQAFVHPLNPDVGQDNRHQRELGLDQPPEPEVSVYKHVHSHRLCGLNTLS